MSVRDVVRQRPDSERPRTTTSGGGGIWTHERVTPLHAFEFCEPAFGHGRRRPPRAQQGCPRRSPNPAGRRRMRQQLRQGPLSVECRTRVSTPDSADERVRQNSGVGETKIIPAPAPDCWLHRAVEIPASSIEGGGLFAIVRIGPGEVVSRLGGRLVRTHELHHLLERVDLRAPHWRDRIRGGQVDERCLRHHQVSLGIAEQVWALRLGEGSDG
jgi:hypothetical protein